MQSPSLPWEPTEALGVFVGLLAEVEHATPNSSAFHDRLCQATARLAHLSRAVVFVWDEGPRTVRAAGTHDVPIDAFEGSRVGTFNVPIARTALAEDRVVEAYGDFHEHMPAELVARLKPRNLVCTPMSSGGAWYGIIMGERQADGPLSDAERHTLWTLGKVAALAASARAATRHQERTRHLTERVALARELHERVTQRLFALGLVLGGPGGITDEQRARCLAEVQEASRDLAAAVQRPVAPVSATEIHTTLAEELERLRAEHPDVGLRPLTEPGVEVPARFEPLAQAVLAEALRNAHKHARPTGIDVALAREHDALVLQVVNDGVVTGRPQSSGVGLKLAALEALNAGALVEFGPEAARRWRVRLVMPLDGT
jgi:signal transduction histidine kinase